MTWSQWVNSPFKSSYVSVGVIGSGIYVNGNDQTGKRLAIKNTTLSQYEYVDASDTIVDAPYEFIDQINEE